ncbi:flagellar basal body rod modification protein [Pseudooceanicola sediminis]|uniref:Basal-body rod modification protein FlgD n=1 Tax=Pseudooceanicola sediminis TaxID=2211117 RepID=A0A399J6R0_9RHOB|nr:flagellar hook capping FlgD N-terminal domain-containing protein [Pseudooceanicola sediminis]KAA2315560.1 flagellar basal body rod modification protein [Puniceibacterium sp. HSS470]RII40237.1 flagellar basal body rod modification protein [Pseudooceanicola sediminis]|tara:strand:+ start:24682 stop:25377 length:696 start_codon:yes stop_codon:yes gene_type:complete
MDVAQTTAAAQTSAASAASSASSASSVNSDAKPGISSDFETFLQMLSTQLKNQDPLNPVESADFAVQLATFSSVEQQVLTNNLLQGLAGQFASSGMSDLANWVGMDARSAAPASYSGSPISIAPAPQAGADETRLIVRNANGTIVSSAPIPVSDDQLEWDGRTASGAALPHGTYTFELENYANGALLGTDVVESYSRVSEARIVDGQTMLVTTSGTMLPSSEISGLRQPGA